LSNVARGLSGEFKIFDFATKFQRLHDTLPGPESFFITNDLYEDFLGFIAGHDFTYDTDSENVLKDLKKAATGDKYFAAIEEEYYRLQQMIQDEKAQDLITFRQEVEQLLREEIVSRYYYQKGRVIVSLASDPDVEKALELLADQTFYRNILAGIE